MKKILTIIIVIVFLSQSSGLSAKRYPLYADKALRPMALRLSGVHEMVQARKNGLRMAVGLPVKESEKVSILFPKTSPALQFQISVTENPNNPILTPDFQKEAFVLNSGAIKISGTYYLAVRSSTLHNHSRIFLATSKDGYNFKREPGFFYEIPGLNGEGGAEDPRLTVVKEFPNRIFMHFTYCHDGIYEVGEDSISVDDFVKADKGGWNGLKVIFPDTRDKNFVLIPNKINGKYYAYHRPELKSKEWASRGIYLAYTDDLINGEWVDLGMVMAPRKDCWIGAGTVLESENAWILIYHEAKQLTDVDRRYVCKIALIDKEDPSNIIYAPEKPILEKTQSETEMLKTITGVESWVANVKFANGAVILGDEKIVKEGSEIIIYYGLDDTVLSAATLKIDKLSIAKTSSAGVLKRICMQEFMLDSDKSDRIQYEEIAAILNRIAKEYGFKENECNNLDVLAQESIINAFSYGGGGKFAINVIEEKDGRIGIELVVHDKDGKLMKSPEAIRMESSKKFPSRGKGFSSYSSTADSATVEPFEGKQWMRNGWLDFNAAGRSNVNEGVRITLVVYLRDRYGNYVILPDRLSSVSSKPSSAGSEEISAEIAGFRKELNDYQLPNFSRTFSILYSLLKIADENKESKVAKQAFELISDIRGTYSERSTNSQVVSLVDYLLSVRKSLSARNNATIEVPVSGIVKTSSAGSAVSITSTDGNNIPHEQVIRDSTPAEDFIPEETIFMPEEFDIPEDTLTPQDFIPEETEFTLEEGEFTSELRGIDDIAEFIEVLKGHMGWVYSAKELNDGRIISASADKTIRIWNLKTKKVITLKDRTGTVNSAEGLSDGRIISTSEDDNTVRIWDLNTNKVITLRGHIGKVRSAEELRDGRIISASFDNTIRIWNLKTNKVIILKGHTGWIYSAKELSDGRIISASYDNTIKVWDLRINKVITLRGHSSIVYSAEELRDGRIISASYDNTIKIWDLNTNKVITLKGHKSTVYAAEELRDGRIISASDDNTIRIWNLKTNKVTILKDHAGIIWSAKELSDGRIISASYDSKIRIWRLPPPQDEITQAELLGKAIRDAAYINIEDNTLLLNISKPAVSFFEQSKIRRKLKFSA